VCAATWTGLILALVWLGVPAVFIGLVVISCVVAFGAVGLVISASDMLE
jgi:hypothetical protein